MSLGKFLAGQIDIMGFIKTLFAKVYAFLFQKEIAQQAEQEKAVKADEKAQLKVVADEQKQVAAIDVEAQTARKQIQVEQQKQAADVVKIEEVKRAKEVRDVDIDRQSDMDAFDSLHSK